MGEAGVETWSEHAGKWMEGGPPALRTPITIQHSPHPIQHSHLASPTHPPTRSSAPLLVQVAGLDVGWGQQVDLQLDPATQRFVVQRELPPGTYQFKFIMVSAVPSLC